MEHHQEDRMKLDTLRASVTARIVKALEAGVKPWSAGWDRSQAFCRPLRHNGKPYRGINVLMLWMSAHQHEFQSPYWMTYRQAAAAGAQVRKGSKGTQVIIYKPIVDETPDGETDEPTRGFSKAYAVFNADQIDGLADHYYPASSAEPTARSHDPLAAYSALMAVHKPKYEEGPQPCYIPARDVVKWPNISVFHTPADQLATVCHELAHWSGARSRLARAGIVEPFEKTRYAYEELVADLAAAFMGASFGILGEQFDNHASYIATWIELLSDNSVIFKAAAEAERVCDFLLTPAVIDQAECSDFQDAA